MDLLAISWADAPITQAQFTLGVVGLVFVLLIFSRLTPDIILIGAVALLLLTGVIDVSQALSGLSNEGMITIAILFVVGGGGARNGGRRLYRGAPVWPAQDARGGHHADDVSHDGAQCADE